jgi:hypothetical protein
MALSALPESKINTEITQPAVSAAPRRARLAGKASRKARGAARVTGDTRESSRDPARVVVEAGCGILVYPPEEAGEPWRATFTENGRRRFRQARTEAELAAKLAKVTERLRAGAPDMERPGADLIAHYLDPDRLPVSKRWSRRHAVSVSCGGPGKPPSMPACILGIRMSSRKRSQLCFDSWTAMIVQPPADGPAAWRICPSGSTPGPGWTAAIDAW